MLNTLRGLSVAALIALLAGCSEGGGGDDPSWTVLVYMVADNNLEPFGLSDLAEMAAVGQGTNMRFVVQVDRSMAYATDGLPGVGAWTGTRRLLVRNGTFELLEDLGSPNMGQAQTLADFISWGVRNYPASQYALVLWDHGGAWPGFGGDESANNDLLNLAELKQGMQQGLAAAGLPAFSVIGFDACLMATYEVAQALSPYGYYLLASEELEPGTGWDYRSFAIIRDDPLKGAVPLGQAVINGFQQQSDAYQKGADVTLALVDLQALSDVTAGINMLATEAASAVATSAADIGRSRGEALKFGENPNPQASTHMVDLGDLAIRLAAADPRFNAARTQITTGLTKAIVYRTSGPVTQHATGLSIYFPPTATYYDAAYDSVAEAATWRTFLNAYFQQASSSGGDVPTFTNPDHLAATAFQSSSFVLQGDLSAGSAEKITRAYLVYGLQDSASGDTFLLGDQPADVDAANGTVTSAWDLTALTLTQGTTTGFGYLSLQVTESNAFAVAIPFEYSVPGKPAVFALRSIVFNSAGQLLSDAYYAPSSGGYSEITGAPGATMYSLVQLIDGSGNLSWAYGSNAFDASDLAGTPLELGFVSASPGRTAFGALFIENFAGNGDYVYNTGTVP